MGDLSSWSERRRTMRVPVRGVAVLYGEGSAIHGRIENLSQSGALVTVTSVPDGGQFEVELKLGSDTGWVRARAVRVEKFVRRVQVAVEFEHLDGPVHSAIEAAIASALSAAQRRPILVLDELGARRRDLATRLTARGMTPLAAHTPLEAIDLLTRAQLHVDVCLFAPSFGHSAAELRALVADSFPWVRSAEISDDLDATVERALEAWSGTDVARMSAALA